MIWALSRTDAEAENPSDLDHVIISITDPDASFAVPIVKKSGEPWYIDERIGQGVMPITVIE